MIDIMIGPADTKPLRLGIFGNRERPKKELLSLKATPSTHLAFRTPLSHFHARTDLGHNIHVRCDQLTPPHPREIADLISRWDNH